MKLKIFENLLHVLNGAKYGIWGVMTTNLT